MITRQLNFKYLPKPISQRSVLTVKNYTTHNAHQLFDKSPQRNFPSLNNSMLTYIHQNLSFKALNLFKTELKLNYPHGVTEDVVAIAFKACCGDPKSGIGIHSFALSSGFIRFRSVSNSLMSMYCKAGLFDHGVRVFDSIVQPDTVSYNTILQGFQNCDDALSFVSEMNAKGIDFDPVTYSTALSLCFDLKGFLVGSQLHSKVLKSGLDCEIFVGNALITLYSRWGRVFEAERVFDEMLFKDLVSWNAILCGYSQDGRYGVDTIWTFREMMRKRIKLDHISLTTTISACGYERNLVMGRLLHGLSIKVGYGKNGVVSNLLMSTYAKCEVNEDVKLVFREMGDRNVVSWTTMISVFPDDALPLFYGMRMEGVYPNDVTFIGLFHAASQRNMVMEGQTIHGFCIKTGCVSELNVSNSLITMYAKFESMGNSLKVFEELQYRDAISWNTLISGYDQNKLYREAVEAFSSALAETQPNEYTFGSILSAIGSAEDISLRHGQRCHSHLLKLGLNLNPVVSGALLDMYAKRGSLDESKKVFSEITQRTQFAWTAIISAHASHGDYDSVMKIVKDMLQEGLKPDSITFLSMLTSCGRTGMVDVGHLIWDTMIKDNLIEPSPEHYACMVDMLGRVGKLKEAEDLLVEIPDGPSFSALQSLLGACRVHGDKEMGERIANRLISMEPDESGSYVVMSNLFAEKGDWEQVAKMRRKMRDRKVRKEVGLSWVDISSTDSSLTLHGFSSDDTSHPRSGEIYRMVSYLGLEMKFLEREYPDIELIVHSSINNELLEHLNILTSKPKMKVIHVT